MTHRAHGIIYGGGRFFHQLGYGRGRRGSRRECGERGFESSAGVLVVGRLRRKAEPRGARLGKTISEELEELELASAHVDGRPRRCDLRARACVR